MNIDDIGTLVRNRRKALQISQKDAAELSKISVHTLSNIESGNGNPTIQVLNEVLTTLGLELKIEVAS